VGPRRICDIYDFFAPRINALTYLLTYSADQIDEHLIDTLIFGCVSETVKSKLLQKDENLTLDEALDIARTEEATRAQLQNLKEKKLTHTDAVQVRPQHPTSAPPYHKAHARQQMAGNKLRTCNNCGTCHSKDTCPAKGSKMSEVWKI